MLLFLLGLIYNNFLQFRFENQRYAGVLQRIAICYGIAAVIFLLTKVRTQVILFVAILLGYWALLAFVPAPESKKAGDYTIETNLSGYLDRQFLPGKINQRLLWLWRQRRAALDDPGGRDGASGGVGRQLAARGSGGWVKALRPGGRRTGLPGLGHALGPGISDHQNPVDQLVRSRGGWMELTAPRILLHRYRRDQIPRLGVLFRRHRRQRNHHLRRRPFHSL